MEGTPSGSVAALVANCFIQAKLDLAPDVEVVPTSKPLSFRAETDLAFTIAAELGANVDDAFTIRVRQTVEDSEHVALIRFWDRDAERPERAEADVLDSLDQACDALSILTGNSVIPIALVITDGAGHWWLRMLPPAEGKIMHLGPGGFFEAIPRAYAKANSSPAYALLCRLFRIAQQARRPEFRIFGYVQVLEIASESLGFNGHLNAKIDGLLNDVQVPPMQFGLLSQLSSNAEAAWSLMRFRHLIAHRGELSPEVASQPADQKLHLLLTDLDQLAWDVRELVRTVLAVLGSRP